MARSEGLLHSKLPPGSAIHTRQAEPVRADDEEVTSEAWQRRGLTELREQLRTIARMLDSRSMPVDEYNSAAITGAGSSVQLSVFPTYDYMPELIEAIIVTGPTGLITLRLGDRIWTLTIPASGLLVIAPIALLLDRSADRILTAAVAGTYTLELMGHGDRRYKI